MRIEVRELFCDVLNTSFDKSVGFGARSVRKFRKGERIVARTFRATGELVSVRVVNGNYAFGRGHDFGRVLVEASNPVKAETFADFANLAGERPEVLGLRIVEAMYQTDGSSRETVELFYAALAVAEA